MPDIETVDQRHDMPGQGAMPNGSGRAGFGTYAWTVALIGLGVALIEEELLAGMAIGVAAMAIPGLAPKIGNTLRPFLKSAVRTGYSVAARTREAVAEMSEQFQDVVAEVRAEQERAESGAEEHSHRHYTEPQAHGGSAAGAETHEHPERPESESARQKKGTRSGNSPAGTPG